MKVSDSFACARPLPGFPDVTFFSLPAAEAAGAGPLSRLPYSLRVLAEHLLRHEDGRVIRAEDIHALTATANGVRTTRDMAFYPSRLMMQDSSGLPVLADFIALEDAVRSAGGDVASVLPRLRMDLVVDHAVEVDKWANSHAAEQNLEHEFLRHADRYRFLKWAQKRLPTLRVVPPGIGICHQLNLEVLADLVQVSERDDGSKTAGFDSLLGTDSHTTMINALSVMGWGVGGIEATAAALGEPVIMKVPEVVGVRLRGRLQEGILATDLALSLTALLRKHDLVQRIVEFFGPGLSSLSIPDRATVANMAPEYGATMGFFPADAQTLSYLRATGRPEKQVALVEAFIDAQHMLRNDESPEPIFSRVIDFDLSSVERTLAGPSRPHDKLSLAALPDTVSVQPDTGGLSDGAIVIASITSCTNTSNPRALVAAGLLAKTAVAKGLRSAPWTKTSFAPGSRVASHLLQQAGLQQELDTLGFNVVGHGCMTCMGNSGPLDEFIEKSVKERGLTVAAVLSGNRNFEGRIHPLCKLSYLASPPLVVALAIAGTAHIDLASEPIGVDAESEPILLQDIWPTDAQIDAVLQSVDVRDFAAENRLSSFDGSHHWLKLQPPLQSEYDWDDEAGFIRKPPFLATDLVQSHLLADVTGARPLLLLGDSVTTDHISPVSRILPDSEAGRWLKSQGVQDDQLASFSARRLNHDVMLRGGFANPRIRNLMVQGSEGGITRLMPDRVTMPIHEAAQIYATRNVPVIVFGGHGYGAGSARDWAAKVTRLLGVRAVIAYEFERIHRTNLVALGVLPLSLPPAADLRLDGSEIFDLRGIAAALTPGGTVELTIHRVDGRTDNIALTARIETQVEAEWLRAGGLMPKVLHSATSDKATGQSHSL